MQKPGYPWRLNQTLKFQPSVGQLMDLCEENYRLLLKIAPGLKTMLPGKHLSSQLPHLDLHLDVIEQSRYTSLIHLTYFFDQSRQADPDAMLRVYHDAGQIEVIDLKQKKLTFLQNYEHPGLLMKWKANVFISKWLSYCLHQGHLFDADSIVTGAYPQPTVSAGS